MQVERYLARLYKYGIIHLFLVRLDLAGFSSLNTAHSAAYLLEKSANLVVPEERRAVRELREYSHGLFFHTFNTKRRDFVLYLLRVRRLACYELPVNVCIARTSSEQVVCECYPEF